MAESTMLPLQVLGQKSRSEILERICSHLPGSFFQLPTQAPIRRAPSAPVNHCTIALLLPAAA